VIEQDHRFVRKEVRASQRFKYFYTAERTLEASQAVTMIRKGEVGSDSMGQAKFVLSLFQTDA
jgi:transposase-like protein